MSVADGVRAHMLSSLIDSVDRDTLPVVRIDRGRPSEVADVPKADLVRLVTKSLRVLHASRRVRDADAVSSREVHQFVALAGDRKRFVYAVVEVDREPHLLREGGSAKRTRWLNLVVSSDVDAIKQIASTRGLPELSSWVDAIGRDVLGTSLTKTLAGGSSGNVSVVQGSFIDHLNNTSVPSNSGHQGRPVLTMLSVDWKDPSEWDTSAGASAGAFYEAVRSMPYGGEGVLVEAHEEMKGKVPRENYRDVQDYYAREAYPVAIFQKLTLPFGHEGDGIDVFLCFAPDFSIVEKTKAMYIIDRFYDELFKYDEHMYRISPLSAVFSGRHKYEILTSQMATVYSECMKFPSRIAEVWAYEPADYATLKSCLDENIELTRLTEYEDDDEE